VEDARPRPAARDALVESPLQLLSAIEAHAAGLGGQRTNIQVRRDVPILARTREALTRSGLPEGVSSAIRSPRAFLSPFASADRIVGDAFSGVFQASLLTRPTRSLVVVDDGLATLHLGWLLASGEPLLRAGVSAGDRRRRLAGLAASRLGRLAHAGRLTLFTALPLPEELRSALSATRVEIVANRFLWLRDRPAEPAPDEPTVVVGSALPANGLIDADRYLAWVLGHATDSPLRYIPHRRSHPAVIEALARTPGISIDDSHVPIELRLAGMRSGQRVLSLPSTAAVLLTTLLTPVGVEVEAFPIPGDWWTDQASPERRAYLHSVLPLVESARTQAEGER